MQIKSIAFILVIFCFVRCTNEAKSVQQTAEKQNDFEQFFEQFTKAVKTKNKVEVSYFINFPLHNLHPCYLQNGR